MRLPVEQLVEKYQKNLYVAAFSMCGNAEDAKDVVQDTFIRYYTISKDFDSEEHIRAWLLRVAVNRAKDIAKSFWHKNRMSLSDFDETLEFETPEENELFDSVMKLPEKYREVIHFFYYEDMSVKEISELLHISENNVKTRLTRGRQLLGGLLQQDN